jgi:hypothetical protein
MLNEVKHLYVIIIFSLKQRPFTAFRVTIVSSYLVIA